MSPGTDPDGPGDVTPGSVTPGAEGPAWLAALREPRGVAVLGASDDPRKISGRALAYLREFGYRGRLYPVNPRRAVVQGVPALARVSDADGPVDLAVVCVPADGVVAALRECAAAGVPLAVVFSSGFGEIGEAGRARQEQLDAVVADTTMRVLGPNSLGLVATERAVVATFTSAMESMRPRDGAIAIVSQSGAFGAFILSSADAIGLGVRYFVSTGNEADLQVPEILEAVAADDGVRVAVVYVEGVRDGAAFRRAALAAAASGTRVLAVKVGTTDAGALAASLHTGALAGSDRVYDVVLAESGVRRMPTLESMLDAAQALAAHPGHTEGRRLTVVTISGGGGIMMVDAAIGAGLELAAWDGEWRARLADVVPPFGSTANPLDVTAELIYRPDLLERVLAVCADHPGTDLVAVLLGNVAGREDELVAVLDAARARLAKPLAVAWVGGSGKAVAKLRATGIPAFTDPVRAVHALAALPAPPVREVPPLVADPGRADAARALLGGARGVLDEVAAKRLLALYGVATPAEAAAASPDEAVARAAAIGGPVAVKLLSAAVTHKEQVGGVKLGLRGDAEVRAAAAEILASAAAADVPDARLVVQAMAPAGFEIFVGARVDAAFGPMVLVGAGGTSVEAVDDSVMASAPVTPAEAERLLRSLRHGALLDDWRGRGPRDVEAAAAVVAGVSVLAAELADRVTQLDVNPVIVGARGAGAVAVDGLVLVADPVGDTAHDADAAAAADAGTRRTDAAADADADAAAAGPGTGGTDVGEGS